jgi:uncharacterized delta-60 repeat protein
MTGVTQAVFMNQRGSIVGWISTLGTTGNDYGAQIAVDSSGNVYVVGSSDVSSYLDLQLAKYDASGVIQWQRRLGSSVGDLGQGIAVDSSANVYVVGYTESGTNPRDIILAKYNTSGAIQWQRKLGGTENDYGYKIAVDSSANVYIVGYSAPSFLAANVLQIAKYNTSGVIQWPRKLSGTNSVYGQGIAVDSSANVYVIGYAYTSGSDDFQIAKYDTSGVIQWQRKFGTAGTDYGRGIAVDSSGNVYVIGYTTSVVDFQIAKYNTSGVIQWQRSLGSATYSDYGREIAVDSSGNVYVVGSSLNSGTSDVQFAKYNTSGVIQWQRRLASTDYDEGKGIAVDSSGNIYVIGTSSASGNYNLLMAKLPGDGTGTGTYSVGGYSYTYAATTLTDASTSWTDAASSLTDAASSLTDAASSLTDTASSLTSNTTPVYA